MLSDKYGRRNVLLVILAVGAGCFFAAGFPNPFFCLRHVFHSRNGCGINFSLGISFMADLLPKRLLRPGT
ncbi:hypothetical protein PO124_16735 [Bacillus licheniformis]|nr:hypothetical protein [Bacillus licheniformis]